MNREDLIKKVQALRALTSSSNLNEAAAAARAAEKLIQDYALEEAEFEFANGSNEKIYEDEHSLTDWGRRQNVWQNILLTALTTAYSCEGILKHKDGKIGFYAVGRPSDISTMRYQFAFFSLEITRLAELLAPNDLGRGTGKRWYNSFYLGAVRAISDSLEATKKQVQNTATSQALAIIDKHAQDAADWMRVYHPEMRTVQKRSRHDQSAYNLGKQAGAGLQSKPGMGTGYRGLLGQ